MEAYLTRKTKAFPETIGRSAGCIDYDENKSQEKNPESDCLPGE
jgi:hypothetical protein